MQYKDPDITKVGGTTFKIRWFESLLETNRYKARTYKEEAKIFSQ